MAFGFNPRLTEAERSDRKVRRLLRKLDRRQRLMDHAAAERANRQNTALVDSCRQQGGVFNAPETAPEDLERKPGAAFRIRYFFSELLSRIVSFGEANRKNLLFASYCLAAALVVFAVSGYLVCYDVYFNGNSLGTVTSLPAVDRALDRYQQDLVEEYDLPSIYFERTVTSSIVLRLSHKNVLNSDDVYARLADLDFPLFCKGAVITIDGKEAIKLASAEDAREAIQRFTELFRSSPESWFKLIDIKEISTQETLGITEKIIAIGSDYTVDEAVRYLCGLAVNGLNNYEAPEDAKKVVDYSLEAGISPSQGQGSSQSRPGYANYDAETFFTTSGIPSTSLIFSADLTPKSEADNSLELNLVAVEEVDYETVVPFEIKEYDSDYYYIGELFTTTVGSNGRKKVHSYITSVNGIMVSEEIIEEAYLKEPVTEMRAKGTRPLPAAYAEGRFVVPTTGLITDTSRDSGSHAGFHAVDIANREGTGIYASDSGTVLKTEWGHYSYGNYIILAHADGYQTLYAHLSYIGVSEGQSVKQLEFIGRMGSTGDSTGPHLHFEIKINGISQYLGAYFDCFVYGSQVHVGQSSNSSYDDKPIVEPGGTTGGDNTGGDNTGGDNTGGDNTGGDNTGGDNTGGDNTGGDNTGGNNTGGNTTDPTDPQDPNDPNNDDNT